MRIKYNDSRWMKELREIEKELEDRLRRRREKIRLVEAGKAEIVKKWRNGHDGYRVKPTKGHYVYYVRKVVK